MIVNILLCIVTFVLFPILWVVNFVYYSAKHFCIDSISKFLYDTALRIDVFGAGEFRFLFNNLLIKKDGIKFERSKYSISYYLGANELNGTLSKWGKLLVFVLDKIDKNHCIKAYNNYEGM